MSYDPYGNYTDILKKSINMRAERQEGPLTASRNASADEASAPEKEVQTSSHEAAAAAVKALAEETAETTPASSRVKSVSEIAESVPVIRDFETIGRNSDISLLDSDVRFTGAKADSVLSQYQYFVNG